jgi:hypothetical protein
VCVTCNRCVGNGLGGAQFLTQAGYCSLRSVVLVVRCGGYLPRGWVWYEAHCRFLRVGGVCKVMGSLPVNICAVSDVKIYGYFINGDVWTLRMYSRVYPVPVAGGELLCEVWFLPPWSIPDHCVRWREYTDGPRITPSHAEDTGHTARPRRQNAGNNSPSGIRTAHHPIHFQHIYMLHTHTDIGTRYNTHGLFTQVHIKTVYRYIQYYTVYTWWVTIIKIISGYHYTPQDCIHFNRDIVIIYC